MTPAEILDGAATLIDRDGWWGHDGYSKAAQAGAIRPRCALIAMSAVAPGLNSWRANKELEAVTGENTPQWNNAPGRTKEEVTAALRTAAAVWRAKNDATAATSGAPTVPSKEGRAEPVAVASPIEEFA